MERTDLTFASGGASCSAWLYRPDGATADVPCVVMAHGFSLTRHDGLSAYAEALRAAGAAVLVFDHRHLGDSGGQPRQRMRIAEQAQDYRCAVAFARGLDGVDAERIVVWGFSFSGGTSVNIAAADTRIAGVILLCPVWVGLGERDISVSNAAVEKLAARAPRAELHRYDVDHFQPFYGEHPAHIAHDQADWLTRAILAQGEVSGG